MLRPHVVLDILGSFTLFATNKKKQRIKIICRYQQFEAANKIVERMPAGLNRVFFTGSGSESADTSLKMARAYWRAKGLGTKTRLIGREKGYHGVNFGGISVGGIVGNRKTFGPALGGIDHIRHTHDLARNAFSVGQPEHGAELADDLERLVQLHDASTIAAVIVEPMAGSTGVLLPPKGYLQRLREICDKHGILLIFDEVITGFGRVGTPFAADYFGVMPDMIVCAKGLTNGTIPMGAVLVTSEHAEAAVVADTLRRAHLVDGVPWAQMAVIVQSVPRTGALLTRALTAAGVAGIVTDITRSVAAARAAYTRPAPTPADIVDAAVKAGMAERWEVSPDRKHYVFHLREGVKWSDGRPVVAQDFVDHFHQRWKVVEPGGGKAMVVCLDKITCVKMHDLIMAKWQEKIAQLEAGDQQGRFHDSSSRAWPRPRRKCA